MISLETVGRLYASGRNYANMGLGFAAGVGIISAAQNKDFLDALGEVYQGVTLVVHGGTAIWTMVAAILAPIIGAFLARKASNSAKTENRQAGIIAIARDPNDSGNDAAKAALIQASAEIARDPNLPVRITDKAKVTIVNVAASLPDVQKVIAPVLADHPGTAPEVVKA